MALGIVSLAAFHLKWASESLWASNKGPPLVASLSLVTFLGPLGLPTRLLAVKAQNFGKGGVAGAANSGIEGPIATGGEV